LIHEIAAYKIALDYFAILSAVRKQQFAQQQQKYFTMFSKFFFVKGKSNIDKV